MIGPSCQVSQDCKPRYTCRFGNCCRDKVCPAGWVEGDTCNTQTGLQKCQKGFQCINGSCCGVPDNFCPSGVVGPVCSEKNPCKSGYTCRFGYCCRNKICPTGMIKGGLCNTQPGKPKCRKGFQCITDICCQPGNTFDGSLFPFYYFLMSLEYTSYVFREKKNDIKNQYIGAVLIKR